MGRVYLCLGKYADQPYFFEKAYVNVYSLEELCYCLMKNEYLIDADIMDKRLTCWLEESCDLKDLSEELEKLLKKNCAVADFAAAILQYAGYGTEEELERARENIVTGEHMSIYEKRKARGDYLVKSRKYLMALCVYHALLKELPDSEPELKGKVAHNIGVVYGALFWFDKAASYFKLAYDCDHTEESCQAWLSACRMFMEETEYVNFAAGEGTFYEQSLLVEKKLEDVTREYEASDKSRMLFTLQVCKEENQTISYYEEMEKLTQSMKEEYRAIVAE